MKNSALLTTTAIAAVFALGLATSALAEGMSYGGQAPNPNSSKFNSTAPNDKSASKSTDVRPEIAKPLKEAVDLGKNNDFPGALAKVKETDAAVTDKSPYEEYVVANFLANFALKANDHATATAALNRALATNVVPEKDLQPTLKLAVTLNAEAKNYPRAIAAGTQLQKLGTIDGPTETNLALAYYNSGDYKNALTTAKAAFALETANGGKPIEATLALIKNAQIKTGDNEGARQTELQLCEVSTTEPKSQCDLARKIKPK